MTQNINQSIALRWDIFCQVIDNLGDIGVSWRLARQLQNDCQQNVRLWVDDLSSFMKIAPQLKRDMNRQYCQNVEICLWQSPFPLCEPADIVIEMFACELPETYVAGMIQQLRAPVWINLEYLSAEGWVREYHGLHSPHPRLPLIKTFFFPGFVPGTGGLLREKDLIESKEAFDMKTERQFWNSIGVPPRKERECRVSLFCYEHAPIAELIAIWIKSSRPVYLIVPEGVVADSVTALSVASSVRSNRIIQSGQLSVQVIPFLEQNRYDQLLRACDLNFVRGEDSFVRAQWAGKPFVWNIYPQSGNAHWKKLNAFLEIYTEHMPDKTASALQKFWHGWNVMDEIDVSAWEAFLDCFELLIRLNRTWRQQLELQNDLTANLIQFVRNQL